MFQDTYKHPVGLFATIYIVARVKKEDTTHDMRCPLNYISV